MRRFIQEIYPDEFDKTERDKKRLETRKENNARIALITSPFKNAINVNQTRKGLKQFSIKW